MNKKGLVLLVKGFLHNRTNWRIPPQQNNQLQRWKGPEWKDERKTPMVKRGAIEDLNDEDTKKTDSKELQWWKEPRKDDLNNPKMNNWQNSNGEKEDSQRTTQRRQPKMDEWRVNGWLQRWKDLKGWRKGWTKGEWMTEAKVLQEHCVGLSNLFQTDWQSNHHRGESLHSVRERLESENRIWAEISLWGFTSSS